MSDAIIRFIKDHSRQIDLHHTVIHIKNELSQYCAVITVRGSMAVMGYVCQYTPLHYTDCVAKILCSNRVSKGVVCGFTVRKDLSKNLTKLLKKPRFINNNANMLKFFERSTD